MCNVIESSTYLQSSYTPTSFAEWETFCDKISRSDLCPSSLKKTKENVFVAVMMGLELGLSPMQAVQNIAVINGRPSLWGDAALALVMSHPKFVDCVESIVGDGDNKYAETLIKKKGCADIVRKFSVADSKKAGLWGKAGPWTQYPDRMLQMRARGFAIRDAFPDALRGINIREEVEDYPKEEKNITPEKQYVVPQSEAKKENQPKSLREAIVVPDDESDMLYAAVDGAVCLDDLTNLLPDLKRYKGSNIDALRARYAAKQMQLKIESDTQKEVNGNEPL